MNSQPASRSTAPLAAALIGVSALALIAYLRAGPMPGASVLAGVATAAFSLWGLARFARIVESGMAGQGTGHRLVMLAAVFKLPIVGFGLYFSVRLAGREPVPLIITVVWVYFCFVWYVARSRD